MGLLVKSSSKAGPVFVAVIFIVGVVTLIGIMNRVNIVPINAITTTMIITATNTGPAFD